MCSPEVQDDIATAYFANIIGHLFQAPTSVLINILFLIHNNCVNIIAVNEVLAVWNVVTHVVRIHEE